MARKDDKVENSKTNKILALLVFLEFTIFIFLIVSFILPSAQVVLGGAGSPNTTVATYLQVGTVSPEILSVIINGGNDIDLTVNSTVNIEFLIIARDFNNESDIQNITIEFFDNINSSFGSSDDNNNHYTNQTCIIDTAYGDQYEVNATCIIPVWYYANNQTWNVTAIVTDNVSLTGSGSNTTIVNSLLGFSLPDSIDYGIVNSTQVSDEQIANVTNAGNLIANLSLSGYGASVGDGWAMNCTQGSVQNISIEYERYNLTASNNTYLNYTEYQSIYLNLSSDPVVREFNVPQRQNDTGQFFDDTNATYWRIYVPVGVAGSCSGNIVFGAVQASGS